MNRILIALYLTIFLTSTTFGQVSEFDISYPLKDRTTIPTLDEEGYVWLINSDKTDFLRYDGHATEPCNLPQLIGQEVKMKEVEIAIFFDGGVILEVKEQLLLFNLTTQKSNVLWNIPEHHLVHFLHKDDEGNIWLFTSRTDSTARPVYKIKPGSVPSYAFDLFPHFGSTYLNWWTVIQDANGLLYFHDHEFGLLILNENGERQSLQLADQQDFDDKFPCSIFQLDNTNKLWRVFENTFEVYDEQSKRFQRHALSGQLSIETNCPQIGSHGFKINFIFIDSQNRIWIGGEDSALFMFDQGKKKLSFFSKELIDHLGGQEGNIHALIEDHTGNLIGSKRGGVFKISPKTSYMRSYLVDTKNKDHLIYHHPDHPIYDKLIASVGELGITNSRIKSIVEEENGDIYLHDSRFYYNISELTNRAEILPFYFSKSKTNIFLQDEVRILSSWNNIFSFDKKFQTQKLPFNGNGIENIVKQKNGNIWYSGFLQRDLESGQRVTFFSTLESLEDLSVSKSYIDAKGTVNFDSIRVYSFDEDADENLWLGTDHGIYKINTSTNVIDHIGLRFSYKNDSITLSPSKKLSVHPIRDRKIAFFNEGMIAIYDPITMALEQYINAKELGVKTMIRAAYFPNEREVWFGDYDGLNHYEWAKKKCIQFSENDELGARSILNCIKPLKGQQIAIGTENGAYIFDPDVLLKNYEEQAKVDRKTALNLVTATYLNGANDSEIRINNFNDVGTEIKLSYNDKMLKFSFALMDFCRPHKHVFSYWLEGYQKTWSAPLKDNVIQFSGLPSGSYTLHAKAHNGSGIWSDNVKSVPILVRVAWFRSWWFIALCIAAVSLLGYLAFRHYLRIAENKHRLKEEASHRSQLQELDRLKTNFYTNITHEFRTPLTVIMGMNENIKDHNKEKTLIRRNSKNLLGLVNQLLDISKMQSNKVSLDYTQGDIVAYLQYLLSSFHSLAEDKNIRLHFESNMESLSMQYNERGIQQICYNLISNALKFSDSGDVVRLKVDREQRDNIDRIVIKVIDTGRGISSELVNHVYDKFYQIDANHDNENQGTGIGLYLAKELIELMEGTISAKSKLDVGTTFTVTLPISNELTSQPAIPLDYENPQVEMTTIGISQSQSPIKIETLIDEDVLTEDALPILLLIEDHNDIVIYVESILYKYYQIVMAKDGAEGINKAIQIIPDIIICDVMMPYKNGFEVCQQLKQDRRTDHIPIILLTAKVADNDRVMGFKLGADAYLNKPFNKDELLVRLEQLILTRTKIQEHYNNLQLLPESDETNVNDKFVTSLQSIILSNLDNVDFGMEDLTKQLFMSQSQVFRKTKAILNKTPVAYIRSIRLAKAKELLLDATLNISEIAYKTGFKTSNYFARIFQGEYGSSPSDFRKRKKRID